MISCRLQYVTSELDLLNRVNIKGTFESDVERHYCNALCHRWKMYERFDNKLSRVSIACPAKKIGRQ